MSYLAIKDTINISDELNNGKTLNIEYDPIERKHVLSIDGYEFYPREVHITIIDKQSVLKVRFNTHKLQSNGQYSDEWTDIFIQNPLVMSQVQIVKVGT